MLAYRTSVGPHEGSLQVSTDLLLNMMSRCIWEQLNYKFEFNAATGGREGETTIVWKLRLLVDHRKWKWRWWRRRRGHMTLFLRSSLAWAWGLLNPHVKSFVTRKPCSHRIPVSSKGTIEITAFHSLFYEVSGKLSACCISGHLHERERRGIEIEIAGFTTYVASPPDGNKDRAVLCIPDVFGYQVIVCPPLTFYHWRVECPTY